MFHFCKIKIWVLLALINYASVVVARNIQDIYNGGELMRAENTVSYYVSNNDLDSMDMDPLQKLDSVIDRPMRPMSIADFSFNMNDMSFGIQLLNAFQESYQAVSNRAGEVFPQQQHKISAALSVSATHRYAHDEQSNVNDIIISSESIKSNNNAWTERDRLLYYTLEQFALLSEFTITQGSTVLRNVIQEASTVKEPTLDLQMYLKSFNDYIASAQNLAKTTDDQLEFSALYDIVVKFTELVEQHNTKTMTGNATTENMFLEMLLKKNGLDKLQVDFLERFLNFIKQFSQRMDRYLEKLTESQRVEEHKMLEWYRMFNDEMDSEKKVDIFSKFFELYQ